MHDIAKLTNNRKRKQLQTNFFFSKNGRYKIPEKNLQFFALLLLWHPLINEATWQTWLFLETTAFIKDLTRTRTASIIKMLLYSLLFLLILKSETIWIFLVLKALPFSNLAPRTIGTRNFVHDVCLQIQWRSKLCGRELLL